MCLPRMPTVHTRSYSRVTLTAFTVVPSRSGAGKLLGAMGRQVSACLTVSWHQSTTGKASCCSRVNQICCAFHGVCRPACRACCAVRTFNLSCCVVLFVLTAYVLGLLCLCCAVRTFDQRTVLDMFAGRCTAISLSGYLFFGR